jgi:ADP-ribose pyrophosphatase YjhB (NUDIX family)
MQLKKYTTNIRPRVCGIAVQQNKILLLNHSGLYDYDFWIPPGGRMEKGEEATENLKREFLEETNLDVTVGRFCFLYEFIGNGIHSLETFFLIDRMKGQAACGFDPELPLQDQIISDIRFMDFDQINRLNNKNKHGIFKYCSNMNELLALSGYFKNISAG